MATCKECGTNIPDESRFCFYCGTPQGEPRPEQAGASWLENHAVVASVALGVLILGAIMVPVFLFGGTLYWPSWVVAALLFAIGMGIELYHLLRFGRPKRSNVVAAALVVGMILAATLAALLPGREFQSPHGLVIRVLIWGTGLACYAVGYWTGYHPAGRGPRKGQAGGSDAGG
jgi:hypothetical protein